MVRQRQTRYRLESANRKQPRSRAEKKPGEVSKVYYESQGPAVAERARARVLIERGACAIIQAIQSLVQQMARGLRPKPATSKPQICSAEESAAGTASPVLGELVQSQAVSCPRAGLRANAAELGPESIPPQREWITKQAHIGSARQHGPSG